MVTATLGILGALGAGGGAAASGGLLSGLGGFLPLAGAGLAGAGAIASGVQEQKMAEFEAKQLKEAGDLERAEGQRKAQIEKRRRDLTLSRARAVSAASGAGATGGSVDAIMEGIQQQGDYNSMVAYFEGDSRGRKLYAQAGARKHAGKAAKGMSFLKAGTNFYDTYSRYS